VSDAPAKEQRDAICAAFSDATVAAVRRWSYDPPARAPLQFYVITSFRRGTEPAIMHTSRALPLEASPSFAGAALTAIYTNPPISTQESLRQRISELGAIIQELTRIRSAMPPGSDTAALDSGVSRLKNELSGVEDALQRAISRGENPGNASIIRPIQSSPFDDPSSLAAPSGRPVYRAGTRYVQSPRLIRNVPPVYTPEAMAAKLEGFVVLEAIVDEQGRVPVARVIRSIPLLDEAALTAAKQWLFAPTLLNGEPVPVLIQIEMRFDMRTTAGPR
jgi:protein TonB